MTKKEKKVLDLLRKAWNLHCKLPKQHGNEGEEMMHHINAAQNIILSRPTLRKLSKKTKP
jgi:hypothetical protein